MSKIKILIVILVGASLPLYVLWKIILVDFGYSSISAAQSGVMISFQTIADQELVVFPEEENYFFNKISLDIQLKEGIAQERELKIAAYQNFLVSFYPQSTRILNKQALEALLFEGNTTDLPIGSLFFNGDSISIMLPNNSYQSIFSAELFEKMGYQWTDVVDKKVGFAGGLEERESFLYGDAHPNGTFIQVEDNYFLVWNDELLALTSEINPSDFSRTSPIKIDTLSPKPFASCQTQAVKNKIICNFEKEINQLKSNYIFASTDLEGQDIEEVKLNLSTSPSKESFRNNFLVSVENIKLKLIKKYRGYIPFI
jgi:hypothetical protein